MAGEMEWVSALEAIRALGGTGDYAGSPQAEAIRKAAEEGRVESRARRFRGKITVSSVSPHVTQSFVGGGEDGNLPVEFWKLLARPTSKRDWSGGRFSYEAPGESWRADGVEFYKDDIEEIGGRFSTAPDRTPPEQTDNAANRSGSGGGNGGRPLSEQWPEFVAELCLWVRDTKNPELVRPNKVLKKINDRLAEREIDEMPRSTAHATLKAVLAALVKASFE